MRPILHHYPMSPFAEKARTVLGFKGLEWTSVQIPSIMPKPDVVALTGGYRKTPIMQLGADIYCDSALIARVLERLKPQPSLFPAESAGLAAVVAQWADSTLFWSAVPYTLQPAGLASLFHGMPPEVLKAFGEDRAAFRKSVPLMRPAEATQSMISYLGYLEAQLGDERKWLLGALASIADFSVYHCLWFVTRGGPLASILDKYPRVQSWFARVKQIGHGVSEQMDSKAAVELAATSKPAPLLPEQFVETHRLPFGTAVTVAATDYGTDPVAGELVISLPDEIGVRRTDVRAGTVVVHFPRLGFEIRKLDASS
jgi:glutathione S-transferase